MRYIFDIGGVLVRYNAEELACFIADISGRRPDDVKTLLHPDLLCKIETGRMSDLDFYMLLVGPIIFTKRIGQ